MYEHFTFIYLLLFQRHRLDPKIGGKKTRNELQKKVIETKERKRKNEMKKKNAQNDLIMCELATEKEKQKGERNYGRKY